MACRACQCAGLACALVAALLLAGAGAVAAGLPEAQATAAGVMAAKAYRREAPQPGRVVSVTDFGAVGDGVTDNHAALQAAFDYATAHGVGVFIPPGTYAHSGTLTANGISISGAGDSSVLKATEYGQEALELTGDGASLSNVEMVGVHGGRTPPFESGEVWVRNAQHFTVENVHITQSSSVGIVLDNSAHGAVLGNTVENTQADSIHITDRTQDVTVADNRIVHSGDDGISVVSYTKDGGLVQGVTIHDNSVIGNDWGRGITVVGGNDVQVTHNHVEGGNADLAGIYIAGEQQWGTYGVHNVTVSANTLKDAGSRGKAGQGAITLYNSSADPLDHIVVFDNTIEAPRKAAILITGRKIRRVVIRDNRVYASAKHEVLANIGEAVELVAQGNIRSSARSGRRE